jgi:Flp pilus assembly protein TadD
MLLGVGLAQGNVKYVGAATALVGVLFIGGSVGGVVHHEMRQRTDSGWFGTTTSWCLAAWASLTVMALVVRVPVMLADSSGLDARRAEVLTSWPALASLALAALLFGMTMADSSKTDVRAPLSVRLREGVSHMTVLTCATLALVGVTTIRVLNADTRVPMPERGVGAHRVLPDARAEARLRPHDAHAQLVLGFSLMYVGKYDEARPVLERAERLAPDNAYARNALGWMLNQQGLFADAAPHLTEAVRLSPDFGSAQHNLGWALLNLRRFREAEIAYRAATRLMPRIPEAASGYARVLFERDKKDAAAAQQLRAVKLDPRNPARRLNASFILRSAARFAEAKVQLEQGLVFAPGNATLWSELGITNYLIHDAPAAATAFDEAARRESAYFENRPTERAMWRSALRGKTGEVQIEPPSTIKPVNQ